MRSVHSKFWAGINTCAYIALSSGTSALALAQDSAMPAAIAPGMPANAASSCLEQGNGFLRARLSGSIRAEIDWQRSMECSGATRPGGGVRMRFSHAFGDKDQQLVLVFGIGELREGEPARNLPVNVTVIRQGAGEFFGTQGDASCMIDELQQEALAGIPLRNRSYRVVARGFCMKPARAINGNGSVLLTRFDFAGRVDFSEEDAQPDDSLAEPARSSTQDTSR
jgi:hypothetical protein